MYKGISAYKNEVISISVYKNEVITK